MPFPAQFAAQVDRAPSATINVRQPTVVPSASSTASRDLMNHASHQRHDAKAHRGASLATTCRMRSSRSMRGTALLQAGRTGRATGFDVGTEPPRQA